MIKVIGVRFRQAGKIYYFDPGEEVYPLGEQVIVETSRGQEIGEVLIIEKEVAGEDVVQPLKKVIRRTGAEDLVQHKDNINREKEAFRICLQKIAKHGLVMKLIRVEYTFDRSKIIFYFTADGRVDFRALVKDLAAIFHTRIELRQIGVRDEAKMIGGIGPCGRSFCCHTFLEEFESVSIKMAKTQNLSLNPTKISGVCGRLMCCLRYEADTYECEKENYPRINARVITPDGDGRVVSVSVVKKTVQVELKEARTQREYPVEEVETIEKLKKT